MNAKIEDYSFRYFGKMNDAMRSLPLGNGDIGVNVWLSQDGNVHFLISKTDAWSELYRLLKPAHIVLKAYPCPFMNGADFDLSIANGTLNVLAGDTCLRIYVDAFAPCVRIMLKGKTPVDARLELLNYRKAPMDPKGDFSNYFVRGGNCNVVESADTIIATLRGGVAQIHRNEDSCYAFSLKTQHMESYMGKEADPLHGLTFGAGIYSPDMTANGECLQGNALMQMEASVFVETNCVLRNRQGEYNCKLRKSQEVFAKFFYFFCFFLAFFKIRV